MSGNNIIQFKPHLDKKNAELDAFKGRHWGDIYCEALGMGMDTSQAMDIADAVVEDMFEAFGKAEVHTVTFKEE